MQKPPALPSLPQQLKLGTSWHIWHWGTQLNILCQEVRTVQQTKGCHQVGKDDPLMVPLVSMTGIPKSQRLTCQLAYCLSRSLKVLVRTLRIGWKVVEMTQAWYNKRTASAAVFFLLQLSLFSPTVVAAVAQGIGRSHHRHSNVVLNIVLPWLWEVARSGIQDSGNIQNLSGVLRWSWHVLTATHQMLTALRLENSRTSQPSSPRDYISLIYIYIYI